jgi:hypothetical protein
MPTAVKLQDIVFGFEGISNETRFFLDLDTGKVDFTCEGIDEDKPPNIRYLPPKYEIHEWQIMDDFVKSMDQGAIQQEFADAIHGRGAFRIFKSAIGRHHLLDAWRQFHNQALEEMAREWCKENDVPFR